VGILDNCCNSDPVVLDRVEKISGVPYYSSLKHGDDKAAKEGKRLLFFKVDYLETAAVDALFASEGFTSVIHFAGLKAVGESCEIPLKYYQNNITGTLNLLEIMGKYNCNSIVFSSSATVYQPCETLLDEDKPLGASNPYGQTKYMIEIILKDLYASGGKYFPNAAAMKWKISILRYFNPVGAHPSGLIGENPLGKPNNLMPFIQQVAVGRRDKLTVFGSDYDTVDGTGVRDYLHVDDLANGHLKALEFLMKTGDAEGVCSVVNLGTGTGFSVLQMIEAFEKNSSVKIAYEVGPRRPGDLATVVAKCDKSKEVLGWTATRDINEIMRSAWKWQSTNPQGYTSA